MKWSWLCLTSCSYGILIVPHSRFDFGTKWKVADSDQRAAPHDRFLPGAAVRCLHFSIGQSGDANSICQMRDSAIDLNRIDRRWGPTRSSLAFNGQWAI